MFRKQFEGELILTPLPNGKSWKLHQGFSYETDLGALIEVPAGFVTDLASVPRILWPLLPPFGRYTGAAVVHDWLYSEHRLGHGHFARCNADSILLEAMIDLNVGRVTRNLVWIGVRLGGWWAWRPRKGTA
jgi:hypothetical protein